MEITHIIEESKKHFSCGNAFDFADFAHALLQSIDLKRITPDSCIEYFRCQPLCKQTFAQARFSQCDLTLYSDKNFCLDVYFWLGQDTAIHDHNFSGAFATLHGESLQLSYGFKGEDLVADGAAAWGKMSISDQRTISAGECVKIQMGPMFIHHLVRLAPRVVTLCLRTQSKPQQWINSYLFPCFALPQMAYAEFDQLLLRLIETDPDSNVSFQMTGLSPRESANAALNILLRRWHDRERIRQLTSFQPIFKAVDFSKLEQAIASHAEHLGRIHGFRTIPLNF